MEINVKRAPKGLLEDDIPYYEKWTGEGGRTIISERLFMLGHDGSVEEVKLMPTYKVGSNYAYTSTEEGEGVSYATSIKDAGYSVEKNSFLIIRREFHDWNMQKVDEMTLIIIEGD